MFYNGVVQPAELTMMTKVLDGYCREHEIRADSSARQNAACMILALYRHGYQTADNLKVALDHTWASTH